MPSLRCPPACLGYRGYRHTVCTSINDAVRLHSIPPHMSLREGDIVNIDVTVILDELGNGDTSRMHAVGLIKRKSARLIDITYESMVRGISGEVPGATTGDIGHAIQAYARGRGEMLSGARFHAAMGWGRFFGPRPTSSMASRVAVSRPAPRHVLHH